MVKINFQGGKNQFSSPVTPANFCAGYACTGNTLIWLVGIRGKTCSVGRRASFTANASQSNESVTCARVAGTEVCGCHRGRKLIFTTVEIDFYYRGKLIFNALEFLFKIFLRGPPGLLFPKYYLIFHSEFPKLLLYYSLRVDPLYQ